MCGIIGVLMKSSSSYQKSDEIVNHIKDGLYMLKNRGYDSCGVGFLNQGEIIIEKYASTTTSNSLSLLSTKLEKRKESYEENNQSWNLSVGIGHNRWATHGSKTDKNAHPHLSYDKKFMIVHNGIIENFESLKETLPSHPYVSETDTEVISHLLSYFYEQTKDTIKSIRLTMKKLQGTYGLVIINCDEPRHMYCVRNGSPLLVGVNSDCAIVTSEQSGFSGSVKTYISLETDDICVLCSDKNKICVTTTQKYQTRNIVTTGPSSLTPAPYAHWTLKEIHEQPESIERNLNMGGRILNNSEVKLGGLEKIAPKLKSVKHMILLGCGSSYNAGLYGADYMKRLCNFTTVQIIDASEFQINDLPKTKECVGVIMISQSGETKDLHRCINIIPETNNIIKIGVVNVVESLIAREVDCGVYCNSGIELGVASTKSFTSQVVCLSLIAIWFAQSHKINHSLRCSMIKSVMNLSNDYEKTLLQVEEDTKELCQTFLKDKKSMFILGKGCDKYIAHEGALKIKEISYVHTESYSASSLKHGPFALLDSNFPVIIINCDDEHDAKITSCYQEVKARHSPIIMITQTSKINEKTIIVPKNKHYGALLGLIPLQLISYYLSIGKNINPDTPKNLAKVVTVD